MKFVNDCDVWPDCPVDYLWIYDKLIVARKQNIVAGPAGIPVPYDGEYIVRPITNIRMMSRGASIQQLYSKIPDSVPDGFFWSEILTGRHISVDYLYGQQHLTVEGFRDNNKRLDRFSRWIKVNDQYPIPGFISELANKTEWLNIEFIGDKAIEIHMRYNDDFHNHDCDEIIPVWNDQPCNPVDDWSWYDSAAGDRLGFWIKNNTNRNQQK